jgi:hypothetical protein
MRRLRRPVGDWLAEKPLKEELPMARRVRRAAGKWILRVLLLLVVLGTLYVSTLAFPNPAFAYKGRFGEFTVYSTQPLPVEMGRVLEGTRQRIASMEHASPGAKCRIFICDSRRYSLFARLTRRAANSMAIGLSAFGNVYVNDPKVSFIAAHNVGRIRHSRFEGNLAEVIAHEVAHFNVVRKLGYRASLRLPVWKSEGYAEYQANLAATRADSAYDFCERIDLLRDNAIWGRDGLPSRRLFEWQLLVEFLAEERGFDLADLVEGGVTEAFAQHEMQAWYEEQRSAR